MRALRGGEDRRRRREIGLADFHVDDAAARPLRARARPSALPSRGTARWRRRARQWRSGNPSKGLIRAGAKSVMVMLAPAAVICGAWIAHVNASMIGNAIRTARRLGVPARLRSPPSRSSRRPRTPTSTSAPATAAPVYQEMPCPPGKELRNFQTDPPEITVLPGSRPGANPTVTPTSRGESERNRRQSREARQAGQAASGDPSERKHARIGMTEAEVLGEARPPDVTTGSKNASSCAGRASRPRAIRRRSRR